MKVLTTDEARQRLDVSAQHVRGLLRAGKLDGRQLASGAWLIDEDSLEQRIAMRVGRGRNWSAISSWALLAELSGEADLVTVSERTRARVRERIRLCSAEEIARRVATRTKVTRYDADDASFWPGADFVSTGQLALDELDTDLASQQEVFEGYVSADAKAEFLRSHMLIPDREGNIGLYEDPGFLAGREHAPRAVIAADLARSTATRVHSAGVAALEGMRQQWLATHTR